MSKTSADAQVLIVPGFHGSGPRHWQSWLETRLPDSRRVAQIDWEQPILATWAGRIRDELSAASAPLHVVAHSFGALATAVAVADRPEKVASLILVAPASPERFDCLGLRGDDSRPRNSLQQVMPWRALDVKGIVVASRNDPWLGFEQARVMADSWQLELRDAGHLGHINEESGHGEWPPILELLHEQRSAHPPLKVDTPPLLRRGRGGALALVRQFTRLQMDSR